ncbi:hypothetical protein LSAT2_023604 [Lamellibrachia satsuma]|nr:hypothetical protein LSAT2_023604 [Lamellibrachia satsuma]
MSSEPPSEPDFNYDFDTFEREGDFEGGSEFEDTHKDRLKNKMLATPFVPIGVTGALATMAYSIFTFRRRGNMSTSVFLMHLRVRAQSMIVGSMAIGVAVTLIKDYMEKGKKEKTTSK